MKLKAPAWWWRHRGFFSYCLLPFSWVFSLAVYLRRMLYHSGLLTVYHAPVPVIVVGNITVGGSGKTPLVIALAQQYIQQGKKPGIVSRGYGGDACDYPRLVKKGDDPRIAGDEPVLLARRTDCPVVIDPNRSRAVQFLLDKHNCDIVISDDGLQHYALARDIEIAVIDADRGMGNRCMLPAGPLREPVSRLENVDYCVYNGEAPEGGIAMRLLPDLVHSVSSDTDTVSLEQLRELPLTAVTAVGNPQRFFATLEDLGLRFDRKTYPDHYYFTDQDFSSWGENVIMTEKDAVKCRNFQGKRLWYLPVRAEFEYIDWLGGGVRS